MTDKRDIAHMSKASVGARSLVRALRSMPVRRFRPHVLSNAWQALVFHGKNDFFGKIVIMRGISMGVDAPRQDTQKTYEVHLIILILDYLYLISVNFVSNVWTFMFA